MTFADFINNSEQHGSWWPSVAVRGKLLLVVAPSGKLFGLYRVVGRREWIYEDRCVGWAAVARISVRSSDHPVNKMRPRCDKHPGAWSAERLEGEIRRRRVNNRPGHISPARPRPLSTTPCQDRSPIAAVDGFCDDALTADHRVRRRRNKSAGKCDP